MDAWKGQQEGEQEGHLVTEGKAKLSLCPVRLGLRIKLTQTDEQEKGIQIFTCTREPSYENEDPPLQKNWQNLNTFILSWTKRGNCRKVSKTYGRWLKDDESYFDKICFYRNALAWLPISGNQNVSFLLVQWTYFYMRVLSPVSRKKGGGQRDLLVPDFFF